MSALDATAALAAAEPGAFLNRDLHMTPKGHDAVARALAATLAEPPSFPTGALPEGRTELPFASPSFAGGTHLRGRMTSSMTRAIAGAGGSRTGSRSCASTWGASWSHPSRPAGSR